MRNIAFVSVLLAAIVGWIVVNPSGVSLGGQATPTPTAEPTLTPTPPTETPTSVTSTESSRSLPDDLRGNLTYLDGDAEVRISLPSATEAERTPAETAASRSPDGLWTLTQACVDKVGCELRFGSTDGRTRIIPAAAMGPVEWSPNGHAVALASAHIDPNRLTQISVITDPATSAPEVAYEVPGGTSRIDAFTWLRLQTPQGEQFDQLLVALNTGTNTQLQVVSFGGGSGIRNVGDIGPGLITRFYPSPDGRTFAFTQSRDDGWRMFTLDVITEELRDLGAMGVGAPDALAPDYKQPFYIAWSPDGSRLAFGGGLAPPYTMTTVDFTTNAAVITEFPYGYPGEIRWSPSGDALAVSTYHQEPVRHELYIVDPATGVARHVGSGCHVVWSPDGRYLTAKGEALPGVSIIAALTGETWRLTSERHHAPISWTE